MYIDFSSEMKKYPLLDLDDVGSLNQFFNDPQIYNRIQHIEQNRRDLINSGIYSSIAGVIGIILILSLSSYEIISDGVISRLVFFLVIGIIGIRTGISKSYKDTNVKRSIMPIFVNQINSNIKYSSTSKYLDESGVSLVEKGIINDYDLEDYIEDSIKFDVSNGITISGAEIRTFKETMIKGKDDKNEYIINNHCYVIKIEYANPKIRLKNGVRIKKDRNENYNYLNFISLLPAALLTGFIHFLMGNQGIFFNKIEYLIIFIIFFIIVNYVIKHGMNKGRTKMENDEFEKKFDVYCKDKLESRMILTPSLMYKLIYYAEKINPNRIYEFHFVENSIYIKFDIQKSGIKKYMEFSFWNDINTNLGQYVEFYLEIKNILDLVEDLNLIYLDKDKYIESN